VIILLDIGIYDGMLVLVIIMLKEFYARQKDSVLLGIVFTIISGGLCMVIVNNWELNEYYLSALLATAASLHLAIGWGSYLYSDNILQAREKRTLMHPNRSSGVRPEESVANDNDLINAMYNGLLPRPSEDYQDKGSPKDWQAVTQRALLWSALTLFIATIYIYYAFGIGSSYY